MPFTLFHLGPALLLGLALSFAFDLPTLMIASIILDAEPLYVLSFRVTEYPLHGFFHSYLGSSVIAVPVALAVYSLRGALDRIMGALRISQRSSFRKTLFTSFVGVYFHVFLDSFLYREMMPFYPLRANPFVNILSAYDSYRVVCGFCSIAAVLGVALYVYRIRKGLVALDK